MAKKAPHDDVVRGLRAFGLAYPGTHTKSPWPGHLDLAVNDKTFAYLGLEGEPLHVSCKLPLSSPIASMLPFAKPSAYGLGKSGWVTATFTFEDELPVPMLEAWIDESYRAQAPKKLVKALDEAIAAGKIAGPRGEAPGATLTAPRAKSTSNARVQSASITKKPPATPSPKKSQASTKAPRDVLEAPKKRARSATKSSPATRASSPRPATKKTTKRAP